MASDIDVRRQAAVIGALVADAAGSVHFCDNSGIMWWYASRTISTFVWTYFVTFVTALFDVQMFYIMYLSFYYARNVWQLRSIDFYVIDL